VLLAGALFAVNAVVRARARGPVIAIDREAVAARIARLEAEAGGPLSADQRRDVEDRYIDEQVLAREARARGLVDDPQISYLLAQKMVDLLSADALQPSDAELEAYYQANRARYGTPARLTLDEIVIPEDSLPPPLRAQLTAGVPPRGLRGEFRIQHGQLADMTLSDLTRVLGVATAEGIFAAGRGAWVGPHRTVRGQHWFRATDRTESVVPSLEEVREPVRLDWIRDSEQARLRLRIAELRRHYSIVLTPPGGGG
jgi:hypothetical protein